MCLQHNKHIMELSPGSFIILFSSAAQPSIAITPARKGKKLTGNALYTLVCTGIGFPLATSQLKWQQGKTTLAGNAERTVLSNGVIQVVRTVMVEGNAQYTCNISSPSVLERNITVSWGKANTFSSYTHGNQQHKCRISFP